MTVLTEILGWSFDRPTWQRDALRRLITGGELSDDDIDTLTDICKSGHGLAEQPDIAPLAEDHIPAKTAGSAPVSLLSIFHHRGVNALAEDQTLRFGPHLTIVYGDNGAGKTGYIRILKGACRARSQEQILGNVTSGAAPLSPVVSIKYKVGDEPEAQDWSGTGEDEFVSRVSVFDTQCAAVYLTEKTDVAFRPFGLDLFDNLVKACKAVRTKLETEQRALSSNAALTAVQAQIPQDTAAAKLLANVSSLTKAETVQSLSRLSSDEKARLSLLQKSLADLKANDPNKLVRQLELRIGRVQSLARHLAEIEAALSEEAVDGALAVRRMEYRKSEDANRLREAFSTGMLTGTGSELWTKLWEAARRFSQEYAYRDQAFPFVEDGAHCVLCQQDLDHAASHRLKHFEAFVTSSTETELRQLRDKVLRWTVEMFTGLRPMTEAIGDVLSEIRIEHEALADAIARALATSESRRNAIISALTENRELPANCPSPVSVAHEVNALAAQLQSRIATLRDSATDETRKSMAAEERELAAREILAKHEKIVLDEIERKKKYAAYSLCVEETRTHAITQKSTAVTKTAVTQKLKTSFKAELAKLAFQHVEVELQEAGGAEGVLYHQLVLTRAPGVELPRVVSEGEQRCLSIAAFFAELSSADDPSGIVFDDPVSSLDYRFRGAVAHRLVQEAKSRQVIVFTHDIVFLHFLKNFAEEIGVDQRDQHVRQLFNGAGVCVEELPWVALNINKKIGHLKNAHQLADKHFRLGQLDVYEREAKLLYGLLREAWERALEEVLLNGVVERFRPSIETQRLARMADVSIEDCRALDVAMSKCSRWLTGHDHAAAARVPVPGPAELKNDITALEDWIAAIRQRRK